MIFPPPPSLHLRSCSSYKLSKCSCNRFGFVSAYQYSIMANVWLLLLAGLLMTSSYGEAGPMAAGICTTGCVAMTVACYSAAGVVFFGTPIISVLALTPALAACNANFGACETGCVAAFLSPTP